MASWDEFQQIGEVPAQDAWGEFTPIGEQVPQEEQPGYAESLANKYIGGIASLVPSAVGGLGYLTGSDTLTDVAKGMEAGLAENLPVNPAYQEDFGMQAADVLASPIHSLSDVVKDVHIVATKRMARYEQPGVGTLTMPALPGSAPISDGPRAFSPGTGAQSQEILADLGYASGDIERLLAQRIVVQKA